MTNREIDMIIEEKLFKIEDVRWIPYYSSDNNDVMLVINRLHYEGNIVDIESYRDYYRVYIKENNVHGKSWEDESTTLPLAVAKCTLKYLGVQ